MPIFVMPKPLSCLQGYCVVVTLVKSQPYKPLYFYFE
jgi:hypothetical protein